MNSTVDRESSGLLKWAIAGTIATGLGLFLTSRKGVEIREEVAERGKKAAKKFKKNREEFQKTVKDTFGEVRSDLEEGYLELQSEVLANIEEAKDMTESKYQKMIDTVVDKYSKTRDWSASAVKNLKKKLKGRVEDHEGRRAQLLTPSP